MTTIADQSTMPIWDWKGWAILAAILFVAALVEKHRNTRKRAAARAAHPAGRLYEASAYQPAADLCHVEGCGQSYRYDIHGWRLCTDCRDELDARQIAEEVFDIDAIENYANGSAA